MNHVLQLLSASEDISRYRTAVIIDGPQAGARAIEAPGIAEGPDDRDADFFKAHWEEVFRDESDGMKHIDGCRVFVETVGAPDEMVICGGGHVSIPVIRIAKMTGFHVTVLEDRPLFAGHARDAGADEVLLDAFEKSLEKVAGSDRSYYVILTRGHRFDMICLQDLLAKRHAYIGMIGSRARVARAKTILEEQGFSRRLLDTLHSPIGLGIGAETPAEIAVAIMAEIIAERSSLRKSSGFPEDIIQGLVREGSKILVTIIERHGSAPRSIGTKMLVMDDGTFAGTIGGGCAENEIIGYARAMLMDEQACIRIAEADMTPGADDDGMVCGGRIQVLMEKITT